MMYRQIEGKIIQVLLNIHSVYWISCCPHAGQFLPKFPARNKRFGRSGLNFG